MGWCLCSMGASVPADDNDDDDDDEEEEEEEEEEEVESVTNWGKGLRRGGEGVGGRNLAQHHRWVIDTKVHKGWAALVAPAVCYAHTNVQSTALECAIAPPTTELFTNERWQ
ncbi:hypothetical protein M0804_015231 [Polistes exclamans]|nr:hypothetical protein M0804_015232 [Polistes exclamans]KAI4473684.1 hypothetical protein M0804_015231 [Polistes exclamans]